MNNNIRKYSVNGKVVMATSNKRAIVSLYPRLEQAVNNGSLSLTKAVKIANRTYGIHLSTVHKNYIKTGESKKEQEVKNALKKYINHSEYFYNNEEEFETIMNALKVLEEFIK